MKKTVLTLVPAMLLGFMLSCSSSDATNRGPATGTWFGWIVDAKTGEKLNFFGDANDSQDRNAVDQIYAVVEGTVRLASPCAQGDITTDNGLSRNGCFKITGLPTDVNIPVFVTRTNYFTFAGTIFIWTDETQEITVNQAMQYDNVRLFPMGVDYSVVVTTTFNDGPVSGVDVRCVMNGDDNTFDVVGEADPNNFLNPSNDFNPVVTGTTDASGSVTFAGDTLTKGGAYTCFAHSDGADGVDLSYDGSGGTDFTVGVSGNAVELELDAAGNGLVAVSKNFGDDLTSNTFPGVAGPLTIIFNRPVDVVSGTAECQKGNYAAGNSGVDATDSTITATNGTANGVSEQLSITMSSDGYTMTITPVYATTSTDDLNARWTNIGGIFLQPRSGVGSGLIYKIGLSSTGSNATNALTGVATQIDAGLTCANMDTFGTGNDVTDISGGDLTTAQMTGL